MKRSIGKTIVTRFILILLTVITLLPFAMMFLTSTKTNAEFYQGMWSLPKNIVESTSHNYSEAWAEGNFGQDFMNTVIISFSALALALMLSSMVSYAIARRNLRHAQTLSNLYLVGLLIPGMVGLTPMFVMARFLGLFNTRIILIILYTAMVMPFCVFLMTSFFRTLPSEMEEAASIDGATPWQAFSKIILPLVRPAFVAAGIFCFLDFWSEYLYGLVFIVDPTKKTISMGMLTFKVISGFKIDWGVTMAACVIFIAPVLILYILFQRQVVGGLTAGSVKG